MFLSFHSGSLFTHLREVEGYDVGPDGGHDMAPWDATYSKVSQSARVPIQKVLLLKRLFIRESSRTCSFILKLRKGPAPASKEHMQRGTLGRAQPPLLWSGMP